MLLFFSKLIVTESDLRKVQVQKSLSFRRINFTYNFFFWVGLSADSFLVQSILGLIN